MKKYVLPIFLWTLIVLSGGCSNFDHLNTDPNAPSTVDPAMIATNLLIGMTFSNTDDYFVGDKTLGKYWVWGASPNEYCYNKLGRGWFDASAFRDGQKMVDLASDFNKGSYEGLALFVRAYKAFYYSMWLGDIPYSEAGKGESEGLLQPKYDSQEFVMEQILLDLRKSAELFAISPDFGGDPIQNGNASQWRKIVNAMRLKVLINLYKKEKVGSVNIKDEFNHIYKNELLMESMNDNFALTYTSANEQQRYPWHKDKTNQQKYSIVSGVFVDLLKKYKDGRLFMFAEASSARLPEDAENGEYETWWNAETWQNWDNFPSLDPMESWPAIAKLFLEEKDYTRLNRHYIYDYGSDSAGEPIRFLGYEQMLFILAEGALRGWIDEDPEYFYNEGVRISLMYADEQCDNYFSHGYYFDGTDINNYLNRIKLTGSFDDKLQKIIEQKYISGFMSYEHDSWFENRRTGYPVFPINVNTSMNTISEKMPLRRMYPEAETTLNYKNLQEAIERQYDGVDDVNKIMWILK